MNERITNPANGTHDVAIGAAAAPFRQCELRFPGWSRRFCFGALFWSAVVFAALLLADVAVADWVNAHVRIARLMWLFEIMKAPGHFAFTLVIAVLLAVWHRAHWRAAAFLCLCGIVSGIIGGLIKWTVGRTRPLHAIPALELHPFRGGLLGLFDAHNLSFPSGHTCLAFATATAMTILIPRWGWAFFAGAIVVATERVLQDSHYVADVVSAAGIGVFSCFLTWWLCDRIIQASRRRSDRQLGPAERSTN